MGKSSTRGWFIWAVVSVFYLYELVLRIIPSVIVTDLMYDFSITATSVGALSAFYYYAYAPLQLPVGILIDRFGARFQLTLACFVCALSSYFFGAAQSESSIAISRLFIGFGSAFAWVALTYLISHWFPPSKRGFLIGLGSSVGLMGGICGQGPMVLLVDAIGWRPTNIYFGLIGLAITLALWIIIRDSPRKKEDKSAATLGSALRGFKSVALNSQSWICALVSVATYMSISVFAELWGISFLQAVHGLTMLEAGNGTSLIYLGMLVGGPIVGALSDKTHLRKPYMVGGTLIAACTIGSVILLPALSLFTIYALLFIFGFAMSSQLLGFSIMIEVNHPFAKGSALAFNNFITMIGGMVMQPVVGWLLDLRWDGHILDGVRLYSVNDYRFAFLALPISCAVGVVLGLGLRETHCKAKDGSKHHFEAHSD